MDQVFSISDLTNLIRSFLESHKRLILREVSKTLRDSIIILPFEKYLKVLLKSGITSFKYVSAKHDVLYLFSPIDYDIPSEINNGLICKSSIPCYTLRNGCIIVLYKGWVGGISCKLEDFALVSNFLYVPLDELF